MACARKPYRQGERGQRSELVARACDRPWRRCVQRYRFPALYASRYLRVGAATRLTDQARPFDRSPGFESLADARSATPGLDNEALIERPDCASRVKSQRSK